MEKGRAMFNSATYSGCHVSMHPGSPARDPLYYDHGLLAPLRSQPDSARIP